MEAATTTSGDALRSLLAGEVGEEIDGAVAPA